jgi:hypothetical protein
MIHAGKLKCCHHPSIKFSTDSPEPGYRPFVQASRPEIYSPAKRRIHARFAGRKKFPLQSCIT